MSPEIFSELEDVFVPLGFFAMITLISYWVLINRHREKMELIKKGINPINSPIPGSKFLQYTYGVFLTSLLISFMGIGFFVSGFITGQYGLSVPGGILLGLGVGGLSFWKLTEKERKKALELLENHMELKITATQEKPNENTGIDQ